MPGTPSFGGDGSPQPASPRPASPPRFGRIITATFGGVEIGSGSVGDFDSPFSAVTPIGFRSCAPRPPCSTPSRPVAASGIDELDGAIASKPQVAPVLERYRMLGVIGHGCFGEVIKAEGLDGKKVAIKSVGEDAGREKRETDILELINHPCVVGLLESFRAPDPTGAIMFYIIMECLCENLHDHLKGQPLRQLETVGLGFQFIRALAHLHGMKICHRDVKPENMLLGEPSPTAHGVCDIRSLKLADFGSAKIMSEGPSTSYICARWWRAPELVVGCAEYGPAVDWWSAACVFAEMMIGAPIFPGSSSAGQLESIMNVIGSPDDDEWRAIGGDKSAAEFQSLIKSPRRQARDLKDVIPMCKEVPAALELMSRLLVYDPKIRMPPAEALYCGFFQALPEEPVNLPQGIFDFTPEELSTCSPTAQKELSSFAARHAFHLQGRAM